MKTLIEIKKNIRNKNWQKICAGEDYSDPLFRHVLINIFKKPLSYHRKQWEFVVIFINLFNAGKLNINAQGASFGAGKESLIYDLLPFIGSFLATDLYSWSTGWNTARLGEKDTPASFLKRHAPKNLSLENLSAKEMDMRTLNIEDNSLDFCYSSCAIEHIGDRDDFLQHLKEVKRVLKNDGVYVVTTELAFVNNTIAVKGNYKFDIDYLKQLFIQSGLDTLTEFDGVCEKSRLNVPRPYLQPLFASKNLEKTLPLSTLWEIEGVAYTSCCFVLSPSRSSKVKTFEESGLKATSNFINNKVKLNMLNLYTDKRSLNPFAGLKVKDRAYLDDHMHYRVDDNTSVISLNNPKFCFTKFIWFSANNARFSAVINLSGFNGEVTWCLIEKDKLQNTNRINLNKTTVTINNDCENHIHHLNFLAKEHKVYALVGQVEPDLFKSGTTQLCIDYIDVSVQLT